VKSSQDELDISVLRSEWRLHEHSTRLNKVRCRRSRHTGLSMSAC